MNHTHNHEQTHEHTHNHEHTHSHDHSLNHEHTHNHDRKHSRILLIRLGISLLLLITGFLIPDSLTIWRISVLVAAWIIAGFDILTEAVENIFHGELLDENCLMIIASVGAFIIGEYHEAVIVILLFQIGEFLEGLAVSKSEFEIKSLVNLRSDHANLLSGNELIVKAPEDIKVNDLILVKPGEKIPLDGTVESGESYVDTSNLTGESVPRKVCEGSKVLSGFVNGNNELTVRVSSEYFESTVARILKLVEEASESKSESENFITSFARIYTPVVVILSAIIGVGIPLISLAAGIPFKESFSYWIYKGMSFLVVSCPCALVISVPLSYFAGIGGASSNGILVKGGNVFDILSKADTFVWDKTGTLTKGVFKVQRIESFNPDFTPNDILKLAAILEMHSNHPIATSILHEYEGDKDISLIKEHKVLDGKGILGTYNGKTVSVGNKSILDSETLKNIPDMPGTCCYVSYDGQPIGYILIADEIKENATDIIKDLKDKNGITNIMLTGDSEETANEVAKALNMDSFHANLLPSDKVSKLSDIIRTKHVAKSTVFIGDGMNDAPVLKTADLGIAMGSSGSDAAIEAADIIIMNDSLSQIPKALQIAKNTKKIAVENIIFSVGVKVIVMVLILLGLCNMYLAVFADVGVCLLAILNSLRAFKHRANKKSV